MRVNALFFALVLGPLRSNALRALVTLVAVALGVAIGLAIDLANATAVASFQSSVNVVSNKVNLQVLGVGRGFDERAIVRVQDIPGVTYASPTIEDALTVGAKPGDPFSGEILRVLGVDLLRPLPGAAGPAASSPGGVAPQAADPWMLVNAHGAFVSALLAERLRWRAGETVHALAGDRDVTLRVAGIIPRGTVGIDSSVVFVDVATAQELFGKIGLLDRIDLVVEPARLASVQRAVAAAIPPGARAIRPKTRTDEIERMLQSFRLNLEALAYVALLVGMYLIYNTVAISVVQRRAEVGTVRALGATRGAVFRTFVGEGALVGVLGSLLGLGVGALLARFSVAAVSRTVDTLYVGSHADAVAYDPVLFVKAFVLGVVAAIAAAAFPAFDAASTPPAITMRAQGFERRRPRLAPRAALAGLGLLLLALLCTRAPALDGVPVFGYAAGLLIIFGGSLCAPLAVDVLARAGTTFAARRPTLGLAAANLAGAPLRTAVAVASLMIAIGMMVSVAVLVASFRTTIVAWADETLRADLFVRPLGLADASADARFSHGVAERIAAVPGVAGGRNVPRRRAAVSRSADQPRRDRSVDGRDAPAPARARRRRPGGAGPRAHRHDERARVRTVRNEVRGRPRRSRRAADAVGADVVHGRGRVQRLLVRRRDRAARRAHLPAALSRRLGELGCGLCCARCRSAAAAVGGRARGGAVADRRRDQSGAAGSRRADFRPDVCDYVRVGRHCGYDRRAGGGFDVVCAGVGAADGVRAVAVSRRYARRGAAGGAD